ncbi:MAG: acyl-CoA reductase [Cyclobacteriaceae bacterium]|nr:acyl-CoA reductase [Cyclobacteriaceae bacterium]
MKLSQRLNAFCSLGNSIREMELNDRKALAERVKYQNQWFTEESVLLSLKGIEVLLEKDKLTTWVNSYSPEPATAKAVGVAMAGNIPAVGFHDFLCVLLSGHKLRAKLSSQDTVLMKFIIEKLLTIEPDFAESILIEEKLNGVDAMIATGSDNTSRYFEYYFRKVPHIIRKNRASCAIILGEEPKEEFELLGNDVFSYFGLGCRNVSKIYIPEEFDLATLMKSWESFQDISNHHKFANNYTYQKSILLLNQEVFWDSGFYLLKESEALVSPISVIFFEKYKTQEEVKKKIEQHRDKLQVITSAQGWFEKSIPFGTAQFPQVNDYADGVDTMRFLKSF